MFKRFFLAMSLVVSSLTATAEVPEAGQVEVFAGAELNYADID